MSRGGAGGLKGEVNTGGGGIKMSREGVEDLKGD